MLELVYCPETDSYQNDHFVLSWERDKNRQWVLRDNQGCLVDLDPFKKDLKERHGLKLLEPERKVVEEQNMENPIDIFVGVPTLSEPGVISLRRSKRRYAHAR